MLETSTSKIKNTVTFSVGKDSLKKTKNSTTGLKEFAENIRPAKLRFDNVAKGYKRAQSEIDKIAKKQAQADKANTEVQLAVQRIVVRG